MNDWNANFATEQDGFGKENDSRFVNRLNLDFAFHATDEVSVHWRLRAPSGQRWGDVANKNGWGERSAAETAYIYGEVAQDWGTVSIGRLSSNFGNLGLANLGYAPSLIDPNFTLMDPFDFDNSEMDGLRWAKRWDNGFQLVAQFNRLLSSNSYEEYDFTPPGGYVTRTVGDEQTADLYTVEGAYFWDGGGASLGLGYLRDHVGLGYNANGYAGWDEDGNLLLIGPGLSGPNRGALKAFYINPAVAHSWDNGFSLHFEGKFGWGKTEVWVEEFLLEYPFYADGYADIDLRGYAFYLDADYNYGPGNVTLAGWWASGADPEGDDDAYNGLVDFGEFKPLLIAYGANVGGVANQRGKVLNAVAEANERSGGFNGINPGANHWAIDLTGRHAFTDDITLTWALAYLALNRVEEGAGKSIGFETDLGLQFQLLDNLKFTTDVGYLFVGKALNDYAIDWGTGELQSVGSKDRVAWYNTLTFSF